MEDTDRCVFCSLPLPGAVRRRSPQPNARATRTNHNPQSSPAYCCYGCRLAAQVAETRDTDEGTSWILVRLGTAIFLSMNVMLMALVLYSKDLFASEGHAGELSSAFYSVLRYGSLVLAAPVLLILGLPILENALGELRHRRLSTDLLFVAGVTAAFTYSAVSTFRGQGVVYFETSCMLLIVVTLGRWMEAACKHRTTRAVTALQRLLPDKVTVMRQGKPVTVKAAELAVNDLVLVKAGENVPVDGVIEEHGGFFNEQALTGESQPVGKVVGDSVFSGTTSLDGSVLVRATAVGADSGLGRLVSLVERARCDKGRYERFSERLAGAFVPIVLVAAGVGAFLGYARGGFETGLMTLLSVVLISCPCALGLATPMAVWSAMGTAARHGVLFRNSEVLERLCRVKTLLFDKTGTLTTDHSQVAEFSAVGGEPRPLLAVAAGLASRSNHPVSRAIEQFAADRGIEPAAVTNVTTIPGQGVQGKLANTRESVWLGNGKLAASHHPQVPERVRGTAKPADHGITYVGIENTDRGEFTVVEALRTGVRSAVGALVARGLDVRVLSGDSHSRVTAIAKTLGITAEGERSPETKLERLRALSVKGPVVMVGDGVNDTPALAGADVGVVLGCGTDVARETADVCLANDDLHRLEWAIDLSKTTVKTIKQNLFWALLYNTFGVGLAMTGRLHPIAAAIAMVVSSLIVVANSLRLGTEQGDARQNDRIHTRASEDPLSRSTVRTRASGIGERAA